MSLRNNRLKFKIATKLLIILEEFIECIPQSGPLYTRGWEPLTIALQALSLVEKAEPVQVHFTLCLRDQQSMWVQHGCKVYMDTCTTSNGSCFMVTWTIFKKPPLGCRPHTKPGDRGTLNVHNRSFILFYYTWRPASIGIHWNSIWLRAQSQMTSHYTWGSMTTLHEFGGVLGGLWTLSFGLSRSLGLTALGSCVKWPSIKENRKMSTCELSGWTWEH